jgi:hypothetical protein
MRRRSRSFERYLGRDERILLRTRQHPLALVGRVGRTLGLLVPLLLASWGFAGVELLRGAAGDWLLRIAFVIMGLLVLRLGWQVVQWEYEQVIVTDEKVIHVEGVLQRRIASTPLSKVSEFTVYQPGLGRVFDYGSLIVDVPGGREQALHGLSYLPDPTGLYRLISDWARTGRTREGGGVEPSNHEVPPMMWVDPWDTDAAPSTDAIDHTIQIPRVHPGGGREQ